ncbi:MAG: DUF1761 domain-containing protein [Pseudomonadota bacterium]
MDMSQAFAQLNWLAIIASTISAFVIGGLWYGPLFGKSWMAENNLTEEQLNARNMAMVFALAFFLSFIAAFNLAMFLGNQVDAVSGAAAGFFAGFGWVACFTGIQYLFEMRSFKLFLINAGYSTVALTIMGAILGAWH